MEEHLVTILQGCIKQDRKSQQLLYKHFYAYGMSICIRYAEDESAAISILNDSFMKVFSRIKKYDQTKAFKPWLRVVIVNTAIDYTKKKNKLMMKEELKEAQNVSEREDILSRIGYKELMTMVHSLTLAYRTVFNMYVIDGFKHEEIANKLGISVGSSKSNLSKARAKLREKITESLQVNHG